MLYEMRGGGGMKGYLVGVVLLSALLSFASLFLRGKEIERAAKVAFALILLCEMLLPLSDLLPAIFGKISEGVPLPPVGAESGGVEEIGEGAFAEGIAAAVAKEFSLPREGITVRIDNFDFSAMHAEKIHLTLRGRGALIDPKKIEDYVTGAGLGDCEVNFEIG